MRKFVFVLGAMIVSTGCVHTAGLDGEPIEERRLDYLETVYLPATKACNRAGGFMILEDTADARATPARLSYADMRLAVARGCGGI